MPSDPDAIARTVLEAHDAARPLARFTLAEGGLDIATAYRAAAALARLRRARGERVVGCKTGFTNRGIWADYEVNSPFFAPVYDTTVAPIPDRFPVGRLLEPRIEPEIVLRLAHRPEPGMDEAALMDCVAAVAHGFEIVESPFPGWRFAVPDIVAASGLHAALLHGPFVPVAPADRPSWLAAFRAGQVTLSCDGAVVARGASANVLDSGPLAAMAYMAETLADFPNLPCPEGGLLTTGTMTDAPRIEPGETWTTALEGLPLAGLTLRLT